MRLSEAACISYPPDTRLKVTISGSLFAQLQWIYDWDNTPASGKERVDSLYLLTIGRTF